jgi:hypothetical protein
MKRERLARFLEFLIVGILIGVVEDLIAIHVTTGESLSVEMVIVVVLVAIPFAAFAELFVDREEIQPFERVIEGMTRLRREPVDSLTDEDGADPDNPNKR